MKKQILFLSFLFLVFGSLHAQDKKAMLGLSISYENFENRPSYSSDKYSRGAIIGLEYSEIRNSFGFSAGLFYSRMEDFVTYLNPDFIFIDIYIIPDPSPHNLIDFPISSQIYLGKKKLKAFASVGLMTSMSIMKKKERDYYIGSSQLYLKSLSLRGIYGAGLTYDLSRHFRIDLKMNRRIRIHTLDNHYLRPVNSFGLETKINYVF